MGHLMARGLGALGAGALLVGGVVNAGAAHAASPAEQLEQTYRCVEKRLVPRALDFYDPLGQVTRYTRPRVGVSKPVTLFGDMDGGVARTVLSGIRAGMVSVPPGQRDELCSLLVLEAESARDVNGNSLETYQSSKDVETRQKRLVDSLRFTKVDRGSVVWLGDIMFDRLTNNLPAMATLLRGLREHGAILITGNHEEYYKPAGCTNVVWACLAKSRSRYTTQEHQKLLDDVFVAAHYDPTNHLLHTHNGVRAEADGSLSTSGGALPAYRDKAPREIAQWLNRQPYDWSFMTRFRPSDAAMEFTQVDDAGQRVSLVHGHNECFSMKEHWVVALNPRYGFRCHIMSTSAITLTPPAAKKAPQRG